MGGGYLTTTGAAKVIPWGAGNQSGPEGGQRDPVTGATKAEPSLRNGGGCRLCARLGSPHSPPTCSRA